MEAPTKEERIEWVQNPVTKWYFEEYLVEGKQSLIDILAAGNTLGDSASTSAQLTARAVGEIAGIDYAMRYRDINED